VVVGGTVVVVVTGTAVAVVVTGAFTETAGGGAVVVVVAGASVVGVTTGIVVDVVVDVVVVGAIVVDVVDVVDVVVDVVGAGATVVDVVVDAMVVDDGFDDSTTACVVCSVGTDPESPNAGTTRMARRIATNAKRTRDSDRGFMRALTRWRWTRNRNPQVRSHPPWPVRRTQCTERVSQASIAGETLPLSVADGPVFGRAHELRVLPESACWVAGLRCHPDGTSRLRLLLVDQ